MTYHLSQHNGITFIECQPAALCLRDERDALDLVAACGENDAPRLLLYADNLAPQFFDLSTRVAGEILLKFTTYRIRAAAVLPPEQASRGKFGEFVLETNRGRDFRVYHSREAAVAWLTSL